jgi:hypothetical protein
VLDPVGHGINEWKDGNKTKNSRSNDWLTSLLLLFFVVVGFYGVGNQFKMNGREMKMTKNKSFSFSSRTVSAHWDAGLALSTGTAARMVS